jgi:hypothetical protein
VEELSSCEDEEEDVEWVDVDDEEVVGEVGGGLGGLLGVVVVEGVVDGVEVGVDEELDDEDVDEEDEDEDEEVGVVVGEDGGVVEDEFVPVVWRLSSALCTCRARGSAETTAASSAPSSSATSSSDPLHICMYVVE